MAEHTMLDNLVILIEDTIRVLIEINIQVPQPPRSGHFLIPDSRQNTCSKLMVL